MRLSAAEVSAAAQAATPRNPGCAPTHPGCTPTHPGCAPTHPSCTPNPGERGGRTAQAADRGRPQPRRLLRVERGPARIPLDARGRRSESRRPRRRPAAGTHQQPATPRFGRRRAGAWHLRTCVVRARYVHMHTWYMHMVHAHGTCTWYVHMVHAHGTCTWCMHMVRAHGACTWYVHMVHAWYVHMVHAWYVHMVRAHGTRTRYVAHGTCRCAAARRG